MGRAVLPYCTVHVIAPIERKEIIKNRQINTSLQDISHVHDFTFFSVSSTKISNERGEQQKEQNDKFSQNKKLLL